MVSEVEDSSTTRVTIDLPCASCRYNLRTLELTGACPECGHPVAETLRQSLLTADPESLADLHSAAGMFLWTALAAGSLAALFVFVALRAPFQQFGAIPGIAVLIGLLFLAGLVLLAELIWVIKWGFRSRAGDPGTGRPNYRRWITVVLIYVLAVFLCASVTRDPLPPVLLALSTPIVALPTYLVAQIRCVAARAGAVDIAGLAKMIVVVGWIGLLGLCVSFTVVVPAMHRWFVAGTPLRLMHEIASGVSILAIQLAVPPVWTFTIILLILFRRTLRRAMTMTETLKNIEP